MSKYHADLPTIADCPGTLALLTFFSLLTSVAGLWLLRAIEEENPAGLVIAAVLAGAGLIATWKTTHLLIRCAWSKWEKRQKEKLKRRAAGRVI